MRRGVSCLCGGLLICALTSIVVWAQATAQINGTVKDAKVVGGHPVLATAALDAVRKWRFEPAAKDTTETIEFEFGAE